MNEPTINTDNICEAIDKLTNSIVEFANGLSDIISAIVDVISNKIKPLWRLYVANTYPNKYHVQMAFHAKKFRVRKKYMNMIFKYYERR